MERLRVAQLQRESARGRWRLGAGARGARRAYALPDADAHAAVSFTSFRPDED